MFCLAAILLFAAAAVAHPTANCPLGHGAAYLADDSNACIYYECTNGFAIARTCGPGTGVLHTSSHTFSHNPCETYYGPCIRGKSQPSRGYAPQPASYHPNQVSYEQPSYEQSYQHSQSSYESFQAPAPQTYQSSHRVSFKYPDTPTTTQASATSVVVQVLPGFGAAGGVRVMGIFTQMQCYEACLNYTDCQSADYDQRDKTCWVHKMETGCNKIEPKENVVHIIILSCSEGLGGSTTNAPTTTAAVTSQPNVDSAYTGFHIFGGVPANASTAVACLSLCSTTTGCQAIDFNFADNTCFLHPAITACGQLRGKESVTHFKLISCPTQAPTQAPAPVVVLPPEYYPIARPINSTLYGMCLGGGILDTLATTYYECYTNCSFGGYACVGFDFNFVTKECRIHTALDECVTTPLSIIGCNHYRFIDCTVFSTPTYIPDTTPWCVQSGVQLFGGVEDPTSPSYETCLLTCKASAGCAGFDYDFATGRCLKHTIQTECNPLSAVVPSATFAHFRKAFPLGVTPAVTCATATAEPLPLCITIDEISLYSLLGLGSATGVQDALRQSIISQLQAIARSQEALSLPADVQATLNVVFDPLFVNALTLTEAQELLSLYEQLVQQVQTAAGITVG